MNQINIALLFVILGCAIVIAIQYYQTKEIKSIIKTRDTEYQRLLRQHVALTNEFDRSKKMVIHQERIIKYFCRFVDEVPEIEKAYNDLIGGNEKR
jgi:hypothetical protein